MMTNALSSAPSICAGVALSIGADNLWALDVLKEAGYRYSSSIYPIKHDHYGMPEAPRYGGVLALVLADVDHFQVYNEAHGHPAGDRCLRRVADARGVEHHARVDRVEGLDDLRVRELGLDPLGKRVEVVAEDVAARADDPARAALR